jgi:hypothetical protein
MDTKKCLIILTALVSIGLLAGCQSSKQNQTVQPGQQVTLTGVMQQGSLTAVSLASYGSGMRLLDTPLVDYKLYCVTFEDSPVGAKGTADSSGKFSLSIKSYTPFGCFVLDSNDQHVADLLFAGLGQSAGTYSGSIMLTNNADVGTITVDPSTGMAVVNVAGVGGISGNNITGTAFDPTGAWNFTCTSNSSDPIYNQCPQDAPSSVYLHRISGIFSSDNKRHYGMGVWLSGAFFTLCGSVEGLCSTPGCTIGQGPVTGTTVTLDNPDGPLQFAFDDVWQAALDGQIHNVDSVCGEPTTLICSQVTNAGNFGDKNGTPFSPGQCRQLCYANGYYQIKNTDSLCMEDRNYAWNLAGDAASSLPATAATTDTNTSFIDFDGHNPVARLMFGELIYSSDTSASEVSTDSRVEEIYDPVAQQPYACPLNSVTKLAFSEVDANTIVGTVDQYLTLGAGSPTQCTSTAIPNNQVPQDMSNSMHMMFKMTK